MSRKGRLTTKGKHALILALTIAACVTAMLFSLLLSVLCDGKYVSSAAHAGDISHPALITGKSETGYGFVDTAMAVLPERWKRY